MGSNLGQDRITAKDVKSCTQYIMSDALLKIKD